MVGDLIWDVVRQVTSAGYRTDDGTPVHIAERATVRPGGAALTAVLLGDQGHDVTLVTAIGAADDLDAVQRHLGRYGVRLVVAGRRQTTPVKERVREDAVTLLRLDRGRREEPTTVVRADLQGLFDNIDGALVEDYGYGAAGIQALRDGAEGAAGRVPVVWDPHPRGAVPVAGCAAVTPNHREARLLTAQRTVTGAGRALRARWRATAVVVTLGARGAVLLDGQHRLLIRTERCDEDATSAGGSLAAALTSELTLGLSLTVATRRAVQAATDFVRRRIASHLEIDITAAAPDLEPTPITWARGDGSAALSRPRSR